jgi:hypothetical protein
MFNSLILLRIFIGFRRFQNSLMFSLTGFEKEGGGSLESSKSGLLAGGPKGADCFEETFEGVAARGLYHIGVGAKGVGSVDVFRQGGGGEDDDGDEAALAVVAHPLDDFEARAAGHFEVEQNETGQGGVDAMLEFSGARKIFDGFFAVADDLEGIVDIRVLEGLPEEKNVIGIVFDDQNSSPRFHIPLRKISSLAPAARPWGDCLWGMGVWDDQG